MNGSTTGGALRSRGSPHRAPGRLAALRARLHRQALDHDLALGIAPWRSPAHAARARQLTGRRRREAYAQGLERVLADTERPQRPTLLGAVLTPDAGAVLLSAPLMWTIVAQLRGAEAVSAEGMVRLRGLLTDGTGPLYGSGQAEELQRALAHIARWLPVAT
jgi:hypothetical protein